jgi:hypothetical protein
MTRKDELLCSQPWCRQPSVDEDVWCAAHLVELTPLMRERVLRQAYDLTCCMCGRNCAPVGRQDMHLTKSEAAAMEQEYCKVCGGRAMLVACAGILGGASDPSIPATSRTQAYRWVTKRPAA